MFQIPSSNEGNGSQEQQNTLWWCNKAGGVVPLDIGEKVQLHMHKTFSSFVVTPDETLLFIQNSPENVPHSWKIGLLDFLTSCRKFPTHKVCRRSMKFLLLYISFYNINYI